MEHIQEETRLYQPIGYVKKIVLNYTDSQTQANIWTVSIIPLLPQNMAM
jgi:hypothetical protein